MCCNVYFYSSTKNGFDRLLEVKSSINQSITNTIPLRPYEKITPINHCTGMLGPRRLKFYTTRNVYCVCGAYCFLPVFCEGASSLKDSATIGSTEVPPDRSCLSPCTIVFISVYFHLSRELQLILHDRNSIGHCQQTGCNLPFTRFALTWYH